MYISKGIRLKKKLAVAYLHDSIINQKRKLWDEDLNNIINEGNLIEKSRYIDI